MLRILIPIFQSALRGSYGGSGVASGHLVSDAVTAAGTEDETDAGPVGELDADGEPAHPARLKRHAAASAATPVRMASGYRQGASVTPRMLSLIHI